MASAFRWVFLVVLCNLAAPACAADRASASVVGYSADGRYFAFEEFGIQDGSGFAYSTYYMIDLSQDRWVVGTPIRVQADNEGQTLEAIRKTARADAETFLADFAISQPAELLVAIGDGAPDQDGKSLVFGVPAPSEPGAVSGHYELSLQTFDTESGSPCMDWFSESAVGYRLTISETGPAREIHQDNVLPRSRGCPADYRLFAVYAPFQAFNIAHTIALVSVYVHGFEGLDRRFIAQPLAFAQGGL